MLGDQGLGYDLGGRHALALGHRGVPFVVDLLVNRRVWGPRWPDFVSGSTSGSLHHFYLRDPSKNWIRDIDREASGVAEAQPQQPTYLPSKRGDGRLSRALCARPLQGLMGFRRGALSPARSAGEDSGRRAGSDGRAPDPTPQNPSGGYGRGCG